MGGETRDLVGCALCVVAGYVRSSHRGQSTVKTKRAPTIRIHAHFGSFGTPLPVLPRQAATRGARDDATECIRGSSSTCDWPATRSDTAACSSSTSACWAPEPVRSSGKASLQHVSRGDSTGHGARPRSRRPQEGLGRNSCDWRITCSLRASSSGPPGPSAAAACAEHLLSDTYHDDGSLAARPGTMIRSAHLCATCGTRVENAACIYGSARGASTSPRAASGSKGGGNENEGEAQGAMTRQRTSRFPTANRRSGSTSWTTSIDFRRVTLSAEAQQARSRRPAFLRACAGSSRFLRARVENRATLPSADAFSRGDRHLASHAAPPWTPVPGSACSRRLPPRTAGDPSRPVDRGGNVPRGTVRGL